MNRFIASSFLCAGLAIVGCSKNDDTSKQVQKAADSTANQASDAMSKMKTTVSEGTDQAKDMAKQSADSMASAATDMQKQIDDLISKAKTAVQDKKWDDAQGYIDQIKGLKSKLPQPIQDKLDTSIADVQKLIDTGKNLVPAKQ